MNELANIRRLRKLTQKQLADIAGIDQATISKIERGGYNYTADMIQRLSEALQVEQAELFGLSELQARLVAAIRAIEDPAQRAAALVVIESMASKPR